MEACYRAAWLWFSNFNCQVINASSETQGQPIDESTEERIEYTHWFNWMPGMYTWCGNSKPLNDFQILNAAISLFLKYLETTCRIGKAMKKGWYMGFHFEKCGIRTPIPFHTPHAFRQPYSSLHVQELSLRSPMRKYYASVNSSCAHFFSFSIQFFPILDKWANLLVFQVKSSV